MPRAAKQTLPLPVLVMWFSDNSTIIDTILSCVQLIDEDDCVINFAEN
jgi:hypothetical protein